MASLAYTHDYQSAIGGFFGGDDSLVFFREEANVPDASDKLSKIFNLTAKIQANFKSMYFSSKFLIKADKRWIFIPDPVKTAVKLGR